ncbi:MAG TPA: D-2-hydroxyacid dehydrogenase [Acidobacteriota bacterium]|jgi:phosphoglycerate dehydrogenase-like enzyme
MKKMVISFRSSSPIGELPAWWLAQLRQRFPAVGIDYLPDFRGLDKAIEAAEIYVGWELSGEQATRARKLAWIQCPTAGVEGLLSPEIIQGPVVITSASVVHRVPAAEHALMLILALARNLPLAAAGQHRRQWAQMEVWRGCGEVNGTCLGIIGAGGIGGELAVRAKALGMRVLGLRQNCDQPVKGVDEMLGVDQLDRLLTESDFVVLAVPDTAATRHIIGKQQLDSMKKSACLINVGRGTAVDQRALADALQSGRIAGAALDVYETEPLPQGSPLWAAPHILITPHVGSATMLERFWRRQHELLAENLRRYLSGEPLLYVVNKRRGY